MVFVYVSSLCPNEPVIRLRKRSLLLVRFLVVLGVGWTRRRDISFYGGSLDIICLMRMYYGGVS